MSNGNKPSSNVNLRANKCYVILPNISVITVNSHVTCGIQNDPTVYLLAESKLIPSLV